LLFAGKTGENPVLTRNRKSAKPSVYKGFRPDESECLPKSMTPNKNRRGLRVESGKSLLPVYRTRIAHTERVAMSTKSKEVRRFALLISAITAVSLALTGCSSPSSEFENLQPKTSKFVVDAFQDGQFLDPFEEGKPDMGLTLEAIANLSILGYSKSDLQKSIDWTIANTMLLDSAALKAKYVFTAYVAGFSEDPSVVAQLQIMKSDIAEDGTVENTNNFAYGYILLALMAGGQDELANKVALKLINNAEISGGYRYVKGDNQSVESADVTSFALMAIQASLDIGTEEDKTAKQFSIDKSKKWLISNLVDGDHFWSFENVDMGGTSFGAMALKSAGEDVTKMQAWLAARIDTANAGLPSPWSGDEADVFTTVQALLPLSGITIADLISTYDSDSSSNN
jgi:hypothetical protein